MRRVGVLLVLACAVALAIAPSPAAATDRAITRGLDYLHARQRTDGGFAEPGKSSSEFMTSWCVVAIASAGEDPSTWKKSGRDPVAYLATQASKPANVTDLARLTLAVTAARRNARDFGGVDLVAKIKSQVAADGSSGDRIGPMVNSHTWGMIALAAAGEPVTSEMVRWLTGQQNSDGGWGWGTSVASDSNDTAAALQALMAAGQSPSSSAVTWGLAYMRTRQASDGGFMYSSGTPDTNSTSWAVQALVAAGETPDGSLWSKSGKSPLSMLRGLQRRDGSFAYQSGKVQNPLFTTVQAIPALARKQFPLPRSAGLAPVSAWTPSVVALNPRSGGRVASGAPVTFRFAVSDGSGTGVAASGVTVRLDGAKMKVTISGGEAKATASSLSSGSHEIKVAVADQAGNTAESKTVEFSAAPGAGGSTAGSSATAGTPGASSASLSATSSLQATASATTTGAAPPGSLAATDTSSVVAGLDSPAAAGAANRRRGLGFGDIAPWALLGGLIGVGAGFIAHEVWKRVDSTR
jgi:hypothetical protein